MNVFIFAIGGTGARVLRSLTFCLASGIEKIPNDTRIIPLIIDYDRTNGDKDRTVKLLDTYEELRKEAYSGVNRNPDDRNFFHPEICKLAETQVMAGGQEQALRPSFVFTFGLDDHTKAGTFADYIDYPGMIGATNLTRDLLSSLYNDEPADFPEGSHPYTELNLDLEKGFRGNPNIGSIIFEKLRDDDEFNRFCNTFNPATDRVFIISSIFGGTGSSGFPRIVDAIRYSGIAGYDTATVGACVVMPYFKVNTPQGGVIHSNIFNSKEKAALSYYAQRDGHGRNIYDKLTTTYFVGDDNATCIEYSEGNSTQKNDAHLVELAAALGVLDFICKPAAGLAARKYREFGIPDEQTENGKFNFCNFDNDTFDDYLQYLFSMAVTFKYYKEYVVSGKIPAKTSYYAGLRLAGEVRRGWYEKFEKFIDDFDHWLDELAHQTDGVKFFKQKSRESNDPVANDLFDYVEGYDAPEGNLFTTGATYKGFTSKCNDAYKKVKNAWGNYEQVFLETLYEASSDIFDKYYQIKK